MRVSFLLLNAVFGLSAQSSPSPDVQAFIPNLTWLKRVEPIWPAGSLAGSAKGTVWGSAFPSPEHMSWWTGPALMLPWSPMPWASTT